MSKWFNENDFEKFAMKQKEAEAEEEATRQSFGKLFPKYSTPYGVNYVLRFLPAVKDKDPSEFFRKMYFHYIPKGHGERGKYIVCPFTFGEEKCPLCRIVSKLYASAEREDREQAGNLRRQYTYVANVYVVDDPRDIKKEKDQRTTDQVKILKFGTQVERKLRGACDAESKTGIGTGVIDPEEGFDFVLKVVEKRVDKDHVYPNYEESGFARQSSAIAEKDSKIKKILEEVHSLDEYVEGERTELKKIMDILESEMLIDYLEDYEKGKFTGDELSDNKEEDENVDKKEPASMPENVDKKEPQPEPESDPEPEGTQPDKGEDKNPPEEEEEESDDFMKKLDALDFDDDDDDN